MERGHSQSARFKSQLKPEPTNPVVTNIFIAANGLCPRCVHAIIFLFLHTFKMACFDPQNQLLASLQIYVDNTLDELSDIAEGNIERWKVGLRDVQNWDADILDQECLVLNDVDPDFTKLFGQIVEDVPNMREFIHVFMIEICRLSSIKNREYFTRFGHRDRGDLQKTVLTKVFRKLELSPKVTIPQHKPMHLNPNDSVSCVPRDVEVSTHSKREEAFNKTSKISAITQNDLVRPPSIRLPPMTREPSVAAREPSVAAHEPSVAREGRLDPIESLPEEECKLFSIISQREPDNSPTNGPDCAAAKEHSRASTIKLSTFTKQANDLESISKKFPEAYNDLMSGVSLMR